MMSITQVRLPQGLIDEVDKLIEKGLYVNKSDVVRDALRKLVLEQLVGSVENTGDSVEEVRSLRKELSKQDLEINNLK